MGVVALEIHYRGRASIHTPESIGEIGQSRPIVRRCQECDCARRAGKGGVYATISRIEQHFFENQAAHAVNHEADGPLSNTDVFQQR